MCHFKITERQKMLEKLRENHYIISKILALAFKCSQYLKGYGQNISKRQTMGMCELHTSPVNACSHKACCFLNLSLNGLILKCVSITLTM